jgi:peptide chain release factor 3
MKRKQFLKGAEQIAQEGAIQIFRLPYSGMEEVIVGVVGTLQFDVFQYRLKNEYGVELIMEGLPYEYLRWLSTETGEPVKEDDLILPTDAKLVEDYKGNQLLLFASQWSIQWTAERNKFLTLSEFGGASL